ncbi:MAG: hypothetical protein EXR27_12925 [Betaproteobacteria bacterium]|nr:hypothetical protein [Betaproteobacteria bacterium]
MNLPGIRKRRTVGDVEGFITLLRAACDDKGMNDALEKLLSMPDEQRKTFVHGWVSDLLVKQAPADFIEAIACLLDDAVAEQAYQVIFQCRR